MVIVVTGGSGSGKSAYAEQLVMDMSQTGERYYLATMQVYDEEGKKKVQRHLNMRAGKGFETIEQPVDIEKAAEKVNRTSTVLLECMSNLTANEMFSFHPSPAVSVIVKKIVTAIRRLMDTVQNLVIVTNNVFEDGTCYEESTLAYMEAFGKINEAVAAYADEVIEVVAGIPSTYKIDAKDQKNLSTGNRRGQSMELYLGGACQGKLNYVQNIHKDMAHIYDGTDLATDLKEFQAQLKPEDSVVLNHFHLWIRKCLKAGAEIEPLIEQLLQNDSKQKVVIICDEIGNGIVPMDAFEREYRERVGRIQCQIAAKAERVERIICGIGQRLK